MTDPELEKFLAGQMMRPEDIERVRKRLDPRRSVPRNVQEDRFWSALEPLYFQAERVRKKRGRSWRHFLVGCGVWAYDKNASTHPDRWKWFYGMNLKYAENERNTCAEQIAIGAAMASSATEIIGLVVIGNPRREDDGSEPPTLPPCPHCRQLMRHSHLIKPSTIIVTVHPPKGKIESWREMSHQIRTFKQLLRDCGEV